MSTQITLKDFEDIYNKTYKNTLRYIVSHCSNMDDINDIIQDTYVEFYKKLKKTQNIQLEQVQGFIIGISKNILKKHYRIKYQTKDNVLNFENNQIEIQDDIDIELQFITKENVSCVWRFLKNKDIKISKIFYMHYGLDMKISDIAKELSLTESGVKNYIYRTIKELKENLNKESDKNAGK